MATSNGLDKSSVYNVEIILDSNIYKPGDSVSGKVYFDLQKRMTCDFIEARMGGHVRVFWIEERVGTSVLRERSSYEQKRQLLDQTTTLWKADPSGKRMKPTIEEITRFAASTSIRPRLQNNDEAPGISAGRSEMEFFFDLPKEGLLSSFDSNRCDGCVNYWIELTCFFENRVVVKRKVLFGVVVPLDLNSIGEASRPVEATQEFKIEGGLVSVSMRAPKSGFVAGEGVNAEITIDNKTKKSIKYCTLNIVQRHFCYATEPLFATRESRYESPGLALPVHKITSGERITYSTSGLFNMPVLPLPIAIPEFLIVDYRIQLVVGFKRANRQSAFAHIQVPIYIGSSPLSLPLNALPSAPTYEADKTTELRRRREAEPTAPPTYTEAMTFGSPPTYEEIDSFQNTKTKK